MSETFLIGSNPIMMSWLQLEVKLANWLDTLLKCDTENLPLPPNFLHSMYSTTTTPKR